MKRGFIPPIDCLIAFESAARHGSFTRAAEELFLTQGAVSKQVRLLEGRLGVELFKRIRQRIVLTDAGRIYLHDIRGTLEKMTSATRQVMSFAGSEDVLNVAVLPTFGTRWLSRRLPQFHERYPEASFNLSVRLRPFDFSVEPFDGAIHYGELYGQAQLQSHCFKKKSFRYVPVLSEIGTNCVNRRIWCA